MTRDEFIAKLPQNNDSRVETILQMIDEGKSILGIEDDDRIQEWYEKNYERLDPEAHFLFYLARFILAHEYTEIRCRNSDGYGGYRRIMEDLAEYIFWEAADICDQIEKFIEEFPSIYDYELISVDHKTIYSVALKYYYYYVYRSKELNRMIAECKDEIAFTQLLNLLDTNETNKSKDMLVKGIRVYLSNNKKKYVDFSSNYANKLFSNVVLQYFYDLFRCNPRNLGKLKSRLESIEVSKKKLIHRTIHEIYLVFAENGYLEYNNSIDHYKLGSKDGKYISTNNNVSRWVYAVFSKLSGQFNMDSLDMDQKKRIRDSLKAYANDKYYQQDDFQDPFNFKEAYSTFKNGDMTPGEMSKFRVW